MQYLIDSRLQGRKEYVVPPEALQSESSLEGKSKVDLTPTTIKDEGEKFAISPPGSPSKKLNMYQPTTI
jgi:hypothetical protein